MRYTSLNDYVTVLKRSRLLILIAIVVGVAIGLGQALAKPERYRASATLSFRDLSQDLSFFGVDVSATQPLNIFNASKAEFVTSPEVAQRVKRELDTPLSPAALAASVSTSIGLRTQFISVTASSGDPEFAAELANEFARQAKRVDTKRIDRKLSDVEDALLGEIQEAARGGGGVRVSVLETQLSRVQTLRDISEPVVLVGRAGVPGSPFSPRPSRDAVVGGLLGLLLGVVVAFTRVALDRRMHTAHDVFTELGAPVIGRIPQTAFGYTGLARNGVGRMWDSDFEAFRLLRANLAYLARGEELRTIVITSAAPGEGKSTVALSLGSAAAVGGRAALVVECDLRRPTFAKRLGFEGDPGLSDYLLSEAEPQDVVREVPMLEPRVPDADSPDSNGAGIATGEKVIGSLVCITAGRTVENPAELLLSNRFAEFLQNVRSAYDLVLLDTGPLLSVVEPLQLIPAVDGVIVCVRAHETTRDQVRATRALLHNVPERPTGAVVTGLRQDGTDTYEYYYGY